ncbi:SUKH-3 domain-containing protein [Streptomyces sp. RS10V-4]|uniref:SUKH-3 domain-containing protein n=1 Tax=Streptomyces rhizoryzae TaxID=2932493 RepID=UPI002002C95E|nr:SUKH-3 domain-containing protein [Streptomyces rhizoryzae]MCK7627685.1 SUKH-3 domain-containing protein [Streptomyces rhizoryzae]
MTDDRCVLHTAGWQPGRDTGNDGMLAILETVSTVARSGPGRWVLFPAAEQSVREFHGLTFRPTVPGLQVAATGCTVDPRLGRYTHSTLAGLSEALGVELFPFGRTDSDALLAVDEQARLFSVDHGGSWLLGASPAEGITALLQGQRPERVAEEKREWLLPPMGEEDTVADAVKTAMVLVFILDRHSVLRTDILRLHVREKTGFGREPLDLEYPLRDGALADVTLRVITELRGRLQAAGFEGFELDITLAAAQARIDDTGASTGPATPRVDCALFAANGDPRVLRVELAAPAGRLAFQHGSVAAAQEEINKYRESRG